MRLRQWDFSEQRRFPGTKSCYPPCKCTRKQINFRAVCWPIQGGRRVWCDRLKQARTTFWPWYINIVKNALGLFAQGENVSAVPPVFRVWLCTLSVLIYCVPVTWNWRWSLLGMSGYTVGFTARGLLLQLVHESSHRPLSLCASRGCVLLPVMAFGWYGVFIVRIGWTNVFLGYIIHLERGNCQPGFG